MIRIVMPLFDFYYDDSEEFEFSGGKYSLEHFSASEELLTEGEGLSQMDLTYLKSESWALIAKNPDISKYKQDINLLLLSFKIYKLARLFIKYRLCKEEPRYNSKLNETMSYVKPEDGNSLVKFSDLTVVDRGFQSLLEMDTVSNRTHNALYFLYRGCFNTHWMDSFILWMCTLESLFSKEQRGGATRTICTRVSKFLNEKPLCSYREIEHLYEIRSRMIHGNIIAHEDPEENLSDLHHLQYVVMECLKKVLDDKTYMNYSDPQQKEDFFDRL